MSTTRFWTLVSWALVFTPCVALAQEASDADTSAIADESDLTAVDVAFHDEQPVRHVVIEVDPLQVVIDKLALNVIFAAKSHHALVLSPYYAWAHAQPFAVFDEEGNGTPLADKYFNGVGCNIGYRYYFERDSGPRGFFIGPTFLLAYLVQKEEGVKTPYAQLGGAFDLGYQALIADRVSVSFGGGVGYTTTTRDTAVSALQFPALVFANRGFMPRFFATLGYAF